MYDPFRTKVKKLTDGQVLWELLYYRTTVASGTSPSEEEARKKLAEARVKAAQLGEVKNKFKREHYAFVREMVMRRPHLVLGVCEALLVTGAEDKRIRDEAGEAERYWHEQDIDPNKRPLSTHGRTLPPEVVAGRLLNAFYAMEYIKFLPEGQRIVTKLKKWAIENFGPIPFGFATQEEAAYAADLAELVIKIKPRNPKPAQDVVPVKYTPKKATAKTNGKQAQ